MNTSGFYDLTVGLGGVGWGNLGVELGGGERGYLRGRGAVIFVAPFAKRGRWGVE